MESMKRQHHSAQLKANVALEALKGQTTVNELASKYGVHTRVLRLTGHMGLEAIHPRPHLRASWLEHRESPIRLQGVEMTRPNQVWGTAINCIPMRPGFMYLVAIMGV